MCFAKESAKGVVGRLPLAALARGPGKRGLRNRGVWYFSLSAQKLQGSCLLVFGWVPVTKNSAGHILFIFFQSKGTSYALPCICKKYKLWAGNEDQMLRSLKL